MAHYTVNEVFYSPQGEGVRAGEMSVFVRFSGCNRKCRVAADDHSPGGFDCDTEFVSGRPWRAEDLVREARHLVGQSDHWYASHASWVVFTGGEPALQLDKSLVDAFHAAQFRCAIETNGSIDVSGLGLDWITVSPKVAEHAVRQMTATEVKYVRGYGQAIPRPVCRATYQVLSPASRGASIDPRALRWCIDLITRHPEWRLSIQQHKVWHVR